MSRTDVTFQCGECGFRKLVPDHEFCPGCGGQLVWGCVWIFNEDTDRGPITYGEVSVNA